MLAGIVAVLMVAIASVALVNMVLAAAALGRRAGKPATYLRPAVPPGDVADRRALEESGTAAALMAHQDRAERIRGLLNFAGLPPEALHAARPRLILTYALCGFANFGSLGILIGGSGAMVPERRHEVVGARACARSYRAHWRPA